MNMPCSESERDREFRDDSEIERGVCENLDENRRIG